MTNIRWWMFPGEPWQITLGPDGSPTDIDQTVFRDIDAALALADEVGLYYTFVIFSGPEALPGDWLDDDPGRQALAGVLGEQLFRRYADHPRILSWEVFNEPEFQIWDGKISQSAVVETVRAIAAQAKAETSSHITVGSAHLDGLAMWVGVGLDYYQAHWYDYMQPGTSCALCTDFVTVRARYKLDKPLVIGEYYGAPEIDALSRLESWYEKGYAGAWAWSLMPERTFDELPVDIQAATEFARRHADLGPTR